MVETGDMFIDKSDFESDFNVDDEYKPVPLIPTGTYTGHTTSVKLDKENQCIVWEVTLDEENEGMLSDGETRIAGTREFYRNWLPKSGDEDIFTKSGKMTKRQAKVNMMKDFADKMQIDMSSIERIVDGITSGDWIGLPVTAKISIGEYEGRHRNQIDDMGKNTPK